MDPDAHITAAMLGMDIPSQYQPRAFPTSAQLKQFQDDVLSCVAASAVLQANNLAFRNTPSPDSVAVADPELDLDSPMNENFLQAELKLRQMAELAEERLHQEDDKEVVQSLRRCLLEAQLELRMKRSTEWDRRRAALRAALHPGVTFIANGE